MSYSTYQLGPIDHYWERLPTVEDVAARLAESDARWEVSSGNRGVEYPDFLNRWKHAKEAATRLGWEGDFRNPPAVFCIPHEDGFAYGFVIKQDNNGTTFVISPVPLPHLED